MQRQIQKNVFETTNKKLMYLQSPLKRAYPPSGLTVSTLLTNNRTHKQRLLCAYRNMVRMVRYLQVHTFLKVSFMHMLKMKIRQDYNCKRQLLLPCVTTVRDLTNGEMYERLVNTVNFVHNATLDDPEKNTTDRPVSAEFKILKGLIQYEMTKSLPPTLRSKLKSKFFTLDEHKEMRASEKAWAMNTCGLQLNLKSDIMRENVWWIDHERGLLRSEVWLDHLTEIQGMKIVPFAEQMVYSLIQYEKSVVIFSEEVKLLV